MSFLEILQEADSLAYHQECIIRDNWPITNAGEAEDYAHLLLINKNWKEFLKLEEEAHQSGFAELASAIRCALRQFCVQRITSGYIEESDISAKILDVPRLKDEIDQAVRNTLKKVSKNRNSYINSYIDTLCNILPLSCLHDAAAPDLANVIDSMKEGGRGDPGDLIKILESIEGYESLKTALKREHISWAKERLKGQDRKGFSNYLEAQAQLFLLTQADPERCVYTPEEVYTLTEALIKKGAFETVGNILKMAVSLHRLGQEEFYKNLNKVSLPSIFVRSAQNAPAEKESAILGILVFVSRPSTGYSGWRRVLDSARNSLRSSNSVMIYQQQQL